MAGIIAHTVGVIAAAGRRITRTVTVGGFSSTWGFSTGLYGAIDDSDFRGATIRTVANTTGSIFRVELSGTRAQDFFASITIGVTTLTTASATHSQSGGNTSWEWGAAIWDSGDSGNNVDVVFQ